MLFFKIRCKDTAFFLYMQIKREKSPEMDDFSLFGRKPLAFSLSTSPQRR